MNSLKFLIICCLIYQALAGSASYYDIDIACVTCTDVLVNLAPLSAVSCDPAINAVQITISYKPEAGMPDAMGLCVNFVPVAINPLIQDYSIATEHYTED